MNARTTALLLPCVCLTMSLAACGADFSDADMSLAEDTDGGEIEEDEGQSDGGSAMGGPADLPEEPDDEDCGTVPFSLGNITPNVMLVLDKSGSMNDFTWDDDGDPGTAEVTRWHSLHGVVDQIATEYEDEMNLGVTLFPAFDAEWVTPTFESACGVAESPDVAIGSGSAAAIMAALPAADDLDFGGATPATAGILTGVVHLENQGEDALSAVILVTDGAANCASSDNWITQYDDDLPLAVADAWEGAGIPTFVVGIDIEEDGGVVEVNPRKALDEVAQVGGVPREGEVGFYDATTPEQLDAALSEITNRVACQIEIEFDPETFAGMVIEADGQSFEELTSCDAGDGWVQIDPDNNPNKIELCNAACEVAAQAGAADANMFCPADA